MICQVVIRFCHIITQISEFVIKVFEVSLKSVWQNRISVLLSDKIGYMCYSLYDKIGYLCFLMHVIRFCHIIFYEIPGSYPTLSYNDIIIKVWSQIIVWQNRISVILYDRIGYLYEYMTKADICLIFHLAASFWNFKGPVFLQKKNKWRPLSFTGPSHHPGGMISAKKRFLKFFHLSTFVIQRQHYAI